MTFGSVGARVEAMLRCRDVTFRVSFLNGRGGTGVAQAW